jgi:hypothetical protein
MLCPQVLYAARILNRCIHLQAIPNYARIAEQSGSICLTIRCNFDNIKGVICGTKIARIMLPETTIHKYHRWKRNQPHNHQSTCSCIQQRIYRTLFFPGPIPVDLYHESVSIGIHTIGHYFRASPAGKGWSWGWRWLQINKHCALDYGVEIMIISML